MRDVLSLQIETKVSVIIIIIVVIIFLITIFKSLDNFNKFIDRINIYEEVGAQEDSRK